MSRGPAEILGLNKGLLRRRIRRRRGAGGAGRAPNRRRGGICAARAKNTPYDGLTLYGRVACTVKAGRVTYMGQLEAIG